MATNELKPAWILFIDGIKPKQYKTIMGAKRFAHRYTRKHGPGDWRIESAKTGRIVVQKSEVVK